MRHLVVLVVDLITTVLSVLPENVISARFTIYGLITPEMESRRTLVLPSGKPSRGRGCDINDTDKGKTGTAFENRDPESEVMRRDRNDGAGHQLLEKQRSCRWIVRGVIPANLSPTRGEPSSGDNKKSTSVTYAAATLHSRQSHGPDILGESNR